jgi:hypothetical protein
MSKQFRSASSLGSLNYMELQQIAQQILKGLGLAPCTKSSEVILQILVKQITSSEASKLDSPAIRSPALNEQNFRVLECLNASSEIDDSEGGGQLSIATVSFSKHHAVHQLNKSAQQESQMTMSPHSGYPFLAVQNVRPLRLGSKIAGSIPAATIPRTTAARSASSGTPPMSLWSLHGLSQPRSPRKRSQSRHKKCSHGKRINLCKECRGTALCEHFKQKLHCSACRLLHRPNSYCYHNRQRNRCKECGGSGICTHGIQKYRCTLCRDNQR